MFRHAARVMLAQVGDFDRPQHSFVARVVRAAMNAATLPAARAALGIDPTAGARAQGAFEAVWSRLQGAIDAAMSDRSLSPDQRAAAIRALRERQTIEANAARKRIMDEERGAARVRRRMRQRPPKKPRQ
jgi:hypothetical protein